MNCPNCGNPTREGQKFCARCGTSLAPAAAPISQQPPQGPVPQAIPQPPTSAPPPPTASYQLPATTYTRSTGRPRRRTSILVALGSLVMLGLLLTLGLLAWLGTAVTSPPAPADPTEVLERAKEALNNVENVKYKAEAGFFGFDTSGSSITSTTPMTVAVEGRIELPRSYTISSNAPQLGSYIVIDDSAWHRRTDSTEWVERDVEGIDLGLINPLTFFNYLQYYQPGTPVEIGAERREDAIVRRIRFRIDTDRMGLETSEPALRSILAISRLDVEAWIEDRTYRIESMVISVESEDGPGIVLRIDFADYNSPTSIEPPTQ